MSDKNLATYCHCGGRFANTISRDAFREKMKIFQNIARFVNVNHIARRFYGGSAGEIRNLVCYTFSELVIHGLNFNELDLIFNLRQFVSTECFLE